MNGKILNSCDSPPFVLTLSKDERSFQQKAFLT
jgi:hypothetical protein